MKKDYNIEEIAKYFPNGYRINEFSLGYIRTVISENCYYSLVPEILNDIAHGDINHSKAVKIYNDLYKDFCKLGLINPKKVKNNVTKDVLVNYCKGGENIYRMRSTRNFHAHWNFKEPIA